MDIADDGYHTIYGPDHSGGRLDPAFLVKGGEIHPAGVGDLARPGALLDLSTTRPHGVQEQDYPGIWAGI